MVEVDRTYTIGVLSERVEVAFDEHYTRTSDQPDAYESMMISDRESDYNWERAGSPTVMAIEEATQVESEIASDIQIILEDKFSNRHADEAGEETEFGSEVHYEAKGANDRAWQSEWRRFEQSLKTEARFFSQSAARHLAKVFEGIDRMQTWNGKSTIVKVGPEHTISTIYRARVFQSSGDLERALERPDLHLCAPPSSLSKAGRMNAHGISVFYGATSSTTALAEVRPPVGSRVIIACFHIVRLLNLLDLSTLRSIISDGSIFDPASKTRFERITFLRSLSARLTKPVMPGDEPAEYLVTQAISDFLATENTPPLESDSNRLHEANPLISNHLHAPCTRLSYGETS